jgi:hypothetical protein
MPKLMKPSQLTETLYVYVKKSTMKRLENERQTLIKRLGRHVSKSEFIDAKLGG